MKTETNFLLIGVLIYLALKIKAKNKKNNREKNVILSFK